MRASLKRGAQVTCLERNEADWDSDEYCPHCDNHFVLDALTPKAELRVEGEDARKDSRCVWTWVATMLKINLRQNDQGRACASRGGEVHIQRQGCPRPPGLSCLTTSTRKRPNTLLAACQLMTPPSR